MKEVHYLYEGEGDMVSATGDKMWSILPGKGGWLGEFFDPNSKPDCWEKERIRPVSFKCTASRCRTLSIDCRKADEIMKSNPRLTESATRAEVADLWGKLHRAQPEHRRLTYEAMVAVAASDGKIEDHEVKLIDDFRSRHNLTDGDHCKALEKVGWTVKQWNARRR
eukprot:TRINITY_DN40489_c0_g1_i1.p1 TRINITY_DN40489_c0_g1~~TRINITY_DN40489_c0_g1_i1.p1  ORF type:complete len:166 (-),score=22.00 TRINITY_DN40489_c0_g1_i1:51-548(-)